jgi:hypothetical protein
LSDPATLLTPTRDPFTTGAAEYYDSPFPGTIPAEPRIYVRIELADLGFETLAMVDTGAPWCILEPGLANLVRENFEELPDAVTLSTRLGRYSGCLYWGIVKLLADEGEALEVQTTVFLSPEWNGGNFVGYLGCLDRVRFAFAPTRS